MTGYLRTGLLKLITSLLLMAGASAVQAGEFCSADPFFGVVNGDAGYVIPTQITIDTDCVFQNFTASNPLTATLNFQTNDPSIYLITFDNVYYTGNMACAAIDHKIWAVNGSQLINLENKASCQDLFIPVETINKAAPAKTSVGVGEVFTYTLTLPYMQAPLGDPSPNELRNVILWDDLSRTQTGADLTYVGINAYYQGSGTPVTMVPELDGTITLPDPNAPGGTVVVPSLCGTWTSKNLCYEPIPVINPGEQIIVEITVKVDNTAGNVTGTTFVNTARWWFGRDIDVNGDGVIAPEEKFVPLPGEYGISEPMTIASPTLVVNKTSPETALNLGVTADFTIDVQNTGGTDAWNATIIDQLPQVTVSNSPNPDLTAGMCDVDPTASVSASIYAADGVTLLRSLAKGVDYAVIYRDSTATPSSTACQLEFVMLTANAAIGAGEHLVIGYTSALDPGTDADGVDLTNIAAATEWFSAAAGQPRITYTGPLTDGTEGTIDNQDSYTITTGLSGYYFQKTVMNVTSGEAPATVAAPGDTLHYRLRVFNVDQTIQNINITDTLDTANFDTATFNMVSIPASATYSFNAGNGQLTITGNPPPLNVVQGTELIVEFEINLASTGLANGDIVSNQATLNATALTALSDNPYVNGIAAPGDPADPTTVEIQYPGAPLKINSQATATIGERFTYTITVPETPVDVPLYDVRIIDDLSATGVDMAFVSASVISGGTWSLTNTGTSTNIVLEDTSTGIDIPALGQAEIQITVELQNTSANNVGDTFSNTATFTYNRSNGSIGTQTQGGSSTTAAMTVVEPSLAVSKVGTLVTPAPISGGSVIEYVISMTNSNTNSSTAYNVNIVDEMPPELLLDGNFTPTATIGGAPVTGFDPVALTTPGGALNWGFGIGDETLDIPPGQTLELTYRAQVQISTAATFNNIVHVDWHSLNNGTTAERNGADCPVITPPNDYCVTQAGNVFSIIDNNSLSKSITADSWTTGGSTPGDSTLRIGDTVTYQVTISLGEGVTDNVRVQDVLPPGMAFDSLISITPASGADSFTYALAAQPGNGDTGTLLWNFGTVTNTPSNDGTPNDTLVIEYNARVLPNAGIAQVASTTLTNTATLLYDDSTGNPVVDPGRLESSATLTLRQPIMSAITKTGNGATNTVSTPLNVDVTTDTVQFQLESCNTAIPAGPAYSVLITDVLPSQIDEGSVSVPVVTINGVVGAAGTDYDYTPPAIRGGNMQFELLTPVFAGECVTIEYQAGFYSDFGANQTWSNSATLGEYWSLIQPDTNAQQYAGSGPAHFYMTNVVGAAPISKVVTSPTTGEVTIGEQVVYTIRVPTTPIGAALTDVIIKDTLHDALSFDSATLVAGSGTLTTGVNLQEVTLGIDLIPAGEQVEITLVANVANNSSASAGTSFTNTVSYTHLDGRNNGDPAVEATSAAVTIVEPLLAINKTVSPTTAPNFNDVLTYSVTFTAASGGNFSDAFDVRIEDDLSLGLVYVAGSASVDGAGNTVQNPVITPAVTGNGVDDPQKLVWSLADNNADIDVPEGSTITLTYQARVLDTTDGVVPGQNLTNSVNVQWTGLDDANANERTGTGTPVENDYFTGPATTSLIVQPSALLKTTATTTASIGDQYTYTITVPSVPQPTPLNDVRITDTLTAAAIGGDLGFVGATVVSGGSWTLTNTGSATNIVLEDTTTGIDIPANGQAVIEITVEVLDTANNVGGTTTITNRANYTYNATQDPGQEGVATDVVIQEPGALQLQKTGPASMRVGQAGTFTIDVYNPGTSAAWDVKIVDQLPNPSPGGMCSNIPVVVSAGIYLADGTTLVTGLNGGGQDYTTNFSSTSCQFVLTMESAAAAIGPDQRLIIQYTQLLDADSVSGTTLTNVAAATEWFSGDTSGTGATGSIRSYTGILSDGTVGTLDEQDAHSLITESPVFLFQKSVANITTGQNPTATASPGDVVEYTLRVENVSPVIITDFSILDDLGAQSPVGVFVPGQLSNITITSTGTPDNQSDPNGGTNGIGLIDVRNLVLGAAGSGNEVVTITYQMTLQPVVTNGTVTLNQASLSSFGIQLGVSDDPNINGADDPNIAGDEDVTALQVTSAPVFITQKTSQDITGDANVLLAGDRLRYTITVQNVGDDHATNVSLSDQIPANTTYVTNTTRLNGALVADVSGASPLQSGMLINAPENTTPGVMRTGVANNTATISFVVEVNSGVASGVIISNQGFVAANDNGGTAVPLTPSDDPSTTVADDPTVDIVGALPLIDSQKTVQVVTDNGVIGIIDSTDILRYTITVTNTGAVDATSVALADALPANTIYVPGSLRLNTAALTDALDADSGDVGGTTANTVTVNLGNVSPSSTQTITFDVEVAGTAVSGDIISNQGVISSNEQLDEPTDADGIDSNGDQPTQVVVGTAQQLTITKQVFVVGGGVATAGGELEYVIRVTNIASVPATNVVITDNLDLPVAGQMTYISGSGLLNGLTAGVSFSDPVVVANYSAVYGDLAPGGVAELRFRVLLSDTLQQGDTVSNTATVQWSTPGTNASDTVTIDIGGTPGSISLNGRVWHDSNFDETVTSGENLLQGWRVELYQNSVLIGTASTDAAGNFQFSGLLPNLPTGIPYELRYVAPGATAATPSMGLANSAFTDGQQSITGIVGASGTSVQNLNMPVQPNGVVYDSVTRAVVGGTRLQMVNAAGTELPGSCFVDSNQQNQTTLASGYYKFELVFGQPECVSGSDFTVNVYPPAGFVDSDNDPTTPNISVIIPPVAALTDPSFDVINCTGDAVPATLAECEVQASPQAPPTSVNPRDALTGYYLKFAFGNVAAGDEQVYNNHIPVDSNISGAVAISKTSSLVNVNRGQLVPYVITVSNTLFATLYDMDIQDQFPAGFKYVADSARIQLNDGAWVKTEPVVDTATRTLTWSNVGPLAANQTIKIKLLLVVSSGVNEGDYINIARVVNNLTNSPLAQDAQATVRVVPDPTFDCTDVIGKVFDDKNLNGYQDEGEKGLPGVRVVTVNGLKITSDSNGRFHIACAAVPNGDRGSNFILKLDERSLPTGYRITTENPRVVRVTRGKMIKVNFGAAIHKVIRLDMADPVFEPGTSEMRPQWVPRLDLLMSELVKDPSILRISYLAENESTSLVNDRIKVVKEEVEKRWETLNCCYRLTIETEVFWRKGGPVDRDEFD